MSETMTNLDFILKTLKELEGSDIKSMTIEEFKGCDFSKPEHFQRAFTTWARGFQDISAWPVELRKEFETKFGDMQDKYDKVFEANKSTVINRGKQLVISSNPLERLSGARAITDEVVARWLGSLANKEYDKARDAVVEAEDILTKSGIDIVSMGRGNRTPSEFRALGTSATAGGELDMPSILIPQIIDYAHEQFVLLDKFTKFRINGSGGTVPRMDSGYTMHSRSQGSAGTFTDPVTGELTFSCNIFATNALLNKELIATSAVGQINQLVLKLIARSVANWWKDKFINGTDSSQPCGLETENTSGYINAETYTAGKLVEAIVKAGGALGGDENDTWEDNAVVIGKKSMRNDVLNEQYGAETAFKIPLDKALGDFSLRGIPWNNVVKVPAGVMYVVNPAEYATFEVVGGTFMTVTDQGYTLTSKNQIMFMYNHWVDGRLFGHGITDDNDRYGAIRISAAV